MTFWKTLILLTFISTALALDNGITQAKRSAEANIFKLLSRSKTQLTRNPNQSLACFGYYNPIMSEIMEVYEEHYNHCIAVAEEARKAADATTVEQRKELDAKAATACNAVNQCKPADKPQSSFQCFIDGGSSSSKDLKALSSDASLKLVVFQKTLRSIASDENICVTENKLQYERDWNRVYDEFTDCINGLTTVPTEAPSPSYAAYRP